MMEEKMKREEKMEKEAVRIKRTPRAPHLRVKIDEAMVRDAVTRDSSYCMIAEAIKSVYPDAQRAAVDLQTIRFTDSKKGLRFTYLTPRIAQVQLVKWDQGIKTGPFEFVLRNGQVTAKQSSSGLAKKGTKKPRTEAQRKALLKASESNPSRRARLLDRSKGSGSVPDRVGGRTPPLQTTKDDVPFSRRRAFGLRALDL